jgi:hypothetical protein
MCTNKRKNMTRSMNSTRIKCDKMHLFFRQHFYQNCFEEKMSLPISKQLADDLYEKAGTLIPEDPEEITIEKYNYLLKDSVHLVIQSVLAEHPLPYKLQNF